MSLTRSRIARGAFGMFLAIAMSVRFAAAAAGGGDFWLDFGKPVRVCPGAREPVPAKLVGQSWGILASGVLLCRDEGQTYSFSVEYLNVRMAPTARPGKGEEVRFDWLGIAVFRPDGHGGTDWLFDAAKPVAGTLSRGSMDRVVFGRISFQIPKASAEAATNMLIYLTFGKPVVVVRVL